LNFSKIRMVWYKIRNTALCEIRTTFRNKKKERKKER